MFHAEPRACLWIRTTQYCRRSKSRDNVFCSLKTPQKTQLRISARAKLAISFSAIIVESRPKTSRRGGRVAEGGGLLNRYRVKSSIGGSNPPLSARFLKTELHSSLFV